MDLKKALKLGGGGVRGDLTGRSATEDEVAELTEVLCEIVDQGKYDKACRRMVAWINDAGLPGAGLLTTYLAISVAQACVDRGVLVDGLEQRVPQFSGIPMPDAISATMHAQDLITKMLDRAGRGENEQPTLDELTEVWKTPQFGGLVLFYYLQCLANAVHLPRLVAVLPAVIDATIDGDVDR